MFAVRHIELEFDVRRRRISVTDTGTGMSESVLRIVLAPHVTRKAGELAASRSRRSRGEKGVGLSFLMFVSNRLAIQTCDGERRLDLTVDDANSWLRSPATVSEPYTELCRSAPDQLLGSPTYTRLTLSHIDVDQFDEDLFEKDPDELVWELRTRTTVGNTAYLFQELGREPAEDVHITLRYTDKRGEEHEPRLVPYRYATPAELLDPAEDVEIVDFDEIEQLDPAEQQEWLEGQALQYVWPWRSASGRPVDVYVFAFDGRAMAEHLRRRRRAGHWAPSNWQGVLPRHPRHAHGHRTQVGAHPAALLRASPVRTPAVRRPADGPGSQDSRRQAGLDAQRHRCRKPGSSACLAP